MSQINAQNMTLSWVIPYDNNAPITAFYILFKQPQFLNSNSVELIVPMLTDTFLITELHPGVTYSFTIVAANMRGNSSISQPVTATTLEEGKYHQLILVVL